MPFALVQAVVSFLFPVRCLGCNAPGDGLCETCLQAVRPANACEQPQISALYDYGDPRIERSIRLCKYRGKSAAFESLCRNSVASVSELLATRMMSETPSSIVLVPIPLSPSHVRRGFNQSELFAASIASMLPKTTVQSILAYTRDVRSQAGISKKADRFENMRGAFGALKPCDKTVSYIIVDDVTTTGATFLDAERALKAAGAAAVHCIALAHGFSRKDARTI